MADRISTLGVPPSHLRHLQRASFRQLAAMSVSVTLTVAIAMLCALTWTVHAQDRRYAVPRTSYGQPDLEGIWQALNTAAWDIEDHSARWGIPAGQGVVEGGQIPYQPWALAQKQKNFANRATADPDTRCFMPGVPRLMYMPFPFEILQGENYVAIVSEYIHLQRLIYTDGQPHIQGLNFWLGDPRGKWEGDTLVVDSTGFNDVTWFDRAGNFHSDALHVVERFVRTGPDHMLYEATIEDPKVFTRPWKMSMPLYRRVERNAQLMEFRCVDFVEELLYGHLRKQPDK